MKRHYSIFRSVAFLSLAFFVLSSLASAALLAADDGFVTALFDGKGLAAVKVSDCEVAVENDSLVLKSGDGLVRSLQRYGDFVLELDWKALRPEKYDSGIYIRADLPPSGKPWPARYQINLKQGAEGNIAALSGATSTGLVKAGDWNHFKVTVVGDTAALEINGKPAWKAAGIEPREGYVGLQAEVAGGGQFEFRNVKVTELGYKSLFNGQDLTGWQGATKGYSIEDGAMVCRKDGGGNLYTADEYADFDFRFEFKLEAGGNNGVGLRAPLSGDAAYAGMEIQILDDYADRYKSLKPYQYHGSIYGVAAAKRGSLRPSGEWNHEEIICRGRQVTVILNGETIVDADLDQVSQPKTADGSAHPGLERKSGYIGFLGHGARVEFRNLRIKDLSK